MSEPIWFTLTRIAFAASSRNPRSSRSGFVTKMSSPTTCAEPPRRSVKAVQPSQSSSASGSSIETIGWRAARSVEERDHLLGGPVRPLEVVSAVLEDLGGGGIHRDRDLGRRARGRRARSPAPAASSASSAVPTSGANPPSSPTPVDMPASRNSSCSAWKQPVPQRSASANEAAPTGITMNSCSSRALSACTPPFSTFIIGVGQDVGVRAAQVAVERLAAGIRRRLRDREGDAEDRVRTQSALVRGPVEVDECAIDAALRECIEPAQRLGDRTVHVRDGVQHALAARARGVTVAQLDRLVLTGGGPGGDARAAERAVVQRDVDLHGGVATRIEDLAGVDVLDQRHGRSMLPDVPLPAGSRGITSGPRPIRAPPRSAARARRPASRRHGPGPRPTPRVASRRAAWRVAVGTGPSARPSP